MKIHALRLCCACETTQQYSYSVVLPVTRFNRSDAVLDFHLIRMLSKRIP